MSPGPERMSAEQYRSMMAARSASATGGGTRRVLGAIPTEDSSGQLRASRREARRDDQLLLLEQAGEISHLRFQVRIPLEGRDGPILTPTGRHMVYIADAIYLDKNGREVVEDSKGHATEVYRIKRAILAAMGVEVVEV